MSFPPLVDTLVQALREPVTIDAVLANFREALRAVVPMMEGAGIPWKRPDAYDEWDSVATALFESLVVSVLRESLSENDWHDFKIPDYDLLLDSYRGMSTLEVEHSSLGAGRWVFHAFGTKETPFDSVEVRGVSIEGIPLDENLAQCPVERARFSLRLEGRGTSGLR